MRCLLLLLVLIPFMTLGGSRLVAAPLCSLRILLFVNQKLDATRLPSFLS